MQGVEGILVIAPQIEAAHAVAAAARRTCRSWPSRAARRAASPLVAVDQVAGAAAVTRHLLELGHPTVWHIAGPEDWFEAQQRVVGLAERAARGRDRAAPIA